MTEDVIDEFDAGWTEQVEPERAEEPEPEAEAAPEAAEEPEKPEEKAEADIEPEPEPVESTEADLEKITQKLKSAAGRLNRVNADLDALDAQYTERQARLARLDEELKRREEALQQQPPEAEDDDTEELREDFPQLIDYIDKRADQTPINAVLKRVEEIARKLEANEVNAENAHRQAHFAAIAEAHPDLDDHRDGLRDWIDNLPHRQAVEYEQITQHGNAAQIVALVNEYKETLKPGSKPEAEPEKTPEPAVDTKRQQQLAASQPGVGKTPAGVPAKERVRKDDFDGGWNEAVSSHS